ncbi:ABC transporter substrate-binding protein [Bilifractor sp. HCP3S3_D3]|uniref:ABC transporter substrate-binding protein n=1 Tax=unclassified Bilifractor TaxID=2815795 RepID=UPI003F8B947D
MKKKLVSIILSGIMAASVLAGCGGTATEEGAETSESAASAESTEAVGSGSSVSSTSGSAAAKKVSDGDVVDIEMYGLGFFGENGLDEVMDEINKISEAKIGVHVNYHILDIATYMQQMPLMLTGGSDQVDLIMDTAMPTTSFSTFTAQNQLMDISEYLDDYAPDAKKLLSEYLPATTIDGAVYALPAYRTYNSSYYIIMRKDILDELGLTEKAQNLSSWSEFKELLQTVHDSQDKLPDNMKTTAMLCNADTQGNVMMGTYTDTAADSFADDYGFDVLGDANRIIRANDDGTVDNYFASDDYKASVERTIDFYNSDLIYKDSATAQDGADQQMANGVTFAYTVQSEIGVEQAKKSATGYDVVCVPYLDVPVQSSNVNTWGWSVPSTSEEPEAAVAFMNLMYTDPDIENLFVYGIEGRDYELNDQGEAKLLDTKEYQNSDFFFGNQFNAYPAEGTGSDFRTKAKEALDNAEISPYFGLVVNTEPIANEQTALSAVLKKYENALESGSADISTLDAMNSELEGAGLQKYLDYYQEQLDNWKAEQK